MRKQQLHLLMMSLVIFSLFILYSQAFESIHKSIDITLYNVLVINLA